LQVIQRHTTKRLGSVRSYTALLDFQAIFSSTFFFYYKDLYQQYIYALQGKILILPALSSFNHTLCNLAFLRSLSRKSQTDRQTDRQFNVQKKNLFKNKYKQWTTKYYTEN
jgi:hypothetical protein